MGHAHAVLHASVHLASVFKLFDCDPARSSEEVAMHFICRSQNDIYICRNGKFRGEPSSDSSTSCSLTYHDSLSVLTPHAHGVSYRGHCDIDRHHTTLFAQDSILEMVNVKTYRETWGRLASHVRWLRPVPGPRASCISFCDASRGA